MEKNITELSIAPGSEVAVAAGCTCCPLRNKNGRGVNGDFIGYEFDMDCPIHREVVMMEISTDDEQY